VNVDYVLSNCNPIKAVVSAVDSGDSTELLTDGTVAVNTGNVRLTPDGDILFVDSVVNSSDLWSPNSARPSAQPAERIRVFGSAVRMVTAR